MRVLLALIFGCMAFGGTPTDGSCGPVLNEMMADPASDWDASGVYSSRDDEWVEVYNPGPGSLTLDGYFIGDATRKPVYGFTGTLDAGSFRLVYGSTAVAWQQVNGVSVTGLGLGNDGDSVTLVQIAGTDTTLVDSYTYNTYEAENDRSSGRRPDGSSNWEMFDAMNPYTGTTPPLGNGLPPTPGLPNDGSAPPPVAVHEATWGDVRLLYR